MPYTIEDLNKLAAEQDAARANLEATKKAEESRVAAVLAPLEADIQQRSALATKMLSELAKPIPNGTKVSFTQRKYGLLPGSTRRERGSYSVEVKGVVTGHAVSFHRDRHDRTVTIGATEYTVALLKQDGTVGTKTVEVTLRYPDWLEVNYPPEISNFKIEQ